MTVVPAAVGFLWPFADASVAEGLTMVLYIGLILGVVPGGWILIKRSMGVSAAGPLWPLLFFMLLASIYALATPQWQTPDEPRHMAYVELVRRGGASLPADILDGKTLTPEEVAVVLDVDRTILRSLRAMDMDTVPADAEAVIDGGQIPGPLELTHPTLYYRVAALVTQPLGDAPVIARMAVLRAFGIMAAAWIVWLCGSAGRLLWPERRRLAEAPMVIVAGIPGFAALAGTVNSDVLVNLVAAAFLAVVLHLLVRTSDRQWAWVLALIGLGVAGVMTKRTFLPLVPIAGVGLLAGRRWRARHLLGGVIAIQVVAGIVLLSLGTRPAVWQEPTGVDLSCRGGVVGPAALCGSNAGVSQRLTVATIEKIAGRPATLGFWTNASRPGHVTLYVGSIRSETVTVAEPGWQFGRVQFVTPEGSREVLITLVADVPLRLDGILLATGKFTPRPPVFADDAGGVARWDGRRVENLLDNGSGEDHVVAAPEGLPENVRRTFNGAADGMYSVFKGDRVSDSWPFIRYRLGQTFGIFWGTAGWDQPPRLLPVFMRWVLAGVVTVGFLAAVAACLGRRRVWPRRAGAAMIAAMLSVIVAVVLRGIPPTDIELVSGRYAFPGVLAIAVVMAAGWRYLVPADDRHFRAGVRWFAVATHLVFIGAVFVPFRWG